MFPAILICAALVAVAVLLPESEAENRTRRYSNSSIVAIAMSQEKAKIRDMQARGVSSATIKAELRSDRDAARAKLSKVMSPSQQADFESWAAKEFRKDMRPSR